MQSDFGRSFLQRRINALCLTDGRYVLCGWSLWIALAVYSIHADVCARCTIKHLHIQLCSYGWSVWRFDV